MNALITNGLIVDGSGSRPFIGDVLIRDGIIAAVGCFSAELIDEDMKCIDAAGRCVTPGFVDIHRHCDYAVFREGLGKIELAQGITTVVSGSCGLTPYPNAPELQDTLTPVLGEKLFEIKSFEAYKNALSKAALPLNIGGMIGSCAVRAAVKGFAKTPFSCSEMNAAKKIVEDAMSDGALGVSLGIMYIPEFYSSIDEMSDAVSVAARYGGVMTAHIRGEGDSLAESVEEAIQIARQADLPLEISHFKCCGPSNWNHGLHKAIDIIEKARKNHDVTVDAYPYNGGATTLLSLIPPDFPRSEWGKPAILEAALSRVYKGWDNYVLSLGFHNILLNGRRMSEHPNPYVLLSETLESEGARAGIIVMSMSSDDVDTVLRLPYASVISDALYPADTSIAHPRLFSAFPKILRDFVFERRILTLEEAVCKMSSKPAERLKLHKRGRLAEGYAADVNIFTLENVRDRSDFISGGLLAEGMDTVFVNGEIAWQRNSVKGNYGKFIGGR